LRNKKNLQNLNKKSSPIIFKWWYLDNKPIQQHIAQACSFRSLQLKGVLSLTIYSSFPAKLARFSKSGRTKDSYIKWSNFI